MKSRNGSRGDPQICNTGASTKGTTKITEIWGHFGCNSKCFLGQRWTVYNRLRNSTSMTLEVNAKIPPLLVQAKANNQEKTEPTPRVAWRRVLLTQYTVHGTCGKHGGDVATGHTPTPSHFPANLRAGGGGGGWVGGGGVCGRLKGRGPPGPQHIWLKVTPSSR